MSSPLFPRLIAALVGSCLHLAAPAEAETAATLYTNAIQNGQAALEAEQPQTAIPYFLVATQLAPQNIATSLYLAEAMTQAGQVQRAEAFLQYRLRQTDQRDNAATYLSGIDQLYRRKPVVFGGSFALLPSTNVTNAPSETNFDTAIGRLEIVDGGAAKTGLGAQVGGQVTYRYPLGHGRSLALRGGLTGVWYDEPRLRYLQPSLSADLRQIGAVTDWQIGVRHAQRRYPDDVNDNADLTRTGVQGSVSRAVASDARVTLSGLAEQRNYTNRNSLSGPYASVALQWSGPFADAGRLQFGAQVERSRTQRDYHRYWGGTLNASYSRMIDKTLRAGLHASATLRTYDATFAAVNFARSDRVVGVGFSVSDSRIKMFGSTPNLSCSYRAQTSNIALYSSRSTDCVLGWRYAF